MSRTDSVRIRHPGRRLFLGVVLLLAALGFAAVAAFRTGPPPLLEIQPALPAIGQRTAVTVRVSEPSRGLAGFRIELLQGTTTVPLADETHTPAPAWAPWRSGVATREVTFEVGKATVASLTGGEATIRVTAARAGALLLHPAPVVLERTLPVRLTPPRLEVLSSQTYVTQGGCEVVVYRAGESSVRDGVRVGARFFPGHSLPGGSARERFALFAAPWDEADPARILLVASDEVGNEASVRFVDRFTPRPPREQTIDLDDRFLTKVVSEIFAATPGLTDSGDLVKNYLEVNGELRRRNSDELLELARGSQEKFLWREPFLALPGSQAMASFADHRSYLYQKRRIDQQTHLGFDLASVAKAPVPAANDGVVALARYFGIYGNTVVVDHGFGLMSLYSHLSSISVKSGEAVRRGQELGRTGTTGLAGGDHLHFAFLLDGLPVYPPEWWDPHWIRDRIGRKLGPALPFHG